MTKLRVPPAPKMPYLRHDVDVQLDRAWVGMQWMAVVNLARKRYKLTKDEYYKAIEIAAIAHGDNPADRTTGREVVQTLVNGNETVKDIDILALYEFAVDGLGLEYSKTMGVLYARLAKMHSKDKTIGVECFESCLRHTDWENAQEIAVSLNKNFPGERPFLFLNILTTSLVARAENAPDNKKKLFANLAKAQVDRAFNLRLVNGKENLSLTEEGFLETDVMLWIDIRRRFGSAEENLKLLSLPKWNPLLFLDYGFHEAFRLSLLLLMHNGKFEEIVRLGTIMFDKIISIGKGDMIVVSPNDDIRAGEGTINPFQSIERYIGASQTWSVLITIVNAARHIPNVPTARKVLKLFHKKVETMVRLFKAHDRMETVYERTYAQLFLELNYTRTALATTTGANVEKLVKLAREFFTSTESFGTLKDYLSIFDDKKQIVQFVHALQNVGNEGGEANAGTEDSSAPDVLDKLACFSLGLRVRYFQATSLKGTEQCVLCHCNANGEADCKDCIRCIAHSALETFRLALRNKEQTEKDEDKWHDLLSGLAVLGSLCLLKLAGAGHKNWAYRKESPLYQTDIQLFLQAVVWLDFCRRRSIHKGSLALILLKLYLTMGCISQTFSLWGFFDVKNSLIECLETFVIDRLASISPAHIMPGPDNFVEPIVQYFDTALRKRGPDAMGQALASGHYVQFLEILQAEACRSRNSVMVLTIIEARRGMRLKNGKADAVVEENALIGSIDPDCQLYDFTEYHALPQWHGTGSTSIQEMISYGPLPSNIRCHLGLLTERFLDLVCYVQSKDFKPSKGGQLQHTDWETTTSSLKALQGRMDVLVSSFVKYEGKESKNELTDPEVWNFRLVNTLAKLVMLVLEDIVAAASTQKGKIIAQAKAAIKILNYQTNDFLNVPDGITGKMQTLHGVAALHAMGMLRESSLATKNTVQYISMVLERIKSKEKARSIGDTAWLTAELKELSLAAAAADKQMKDRVKKLTDNVNSSGWVDRLDDWTFGDNTVLRGENRDFKMSMASALAEMIPQADREVWANDIADSWRATMKSWSAVKFD